MARKGKLGEAYITVPDVPAFEPARHGSGKLIPDPRPHGQKRPLGTGKGCGGSSIVPAGVHVPAPATGT
eukprot:10009593-Alexandrium_andersonii.AAC.1